MFVSTGQAITLQEAAQEAVLKNPEVLTRWHAYKAATEEIGVVRGAYRPRVDVTAGIARERQDTPTLDDTYTRSQLSLIFNQMLFDGHATRNQVTKFNHAQRVRYYELLDAAETAASEAMRAYVDVLRFRKLHQLAQENYVQHRIVFEQIQQRVKSGVGRRVDLEQASGRLALAESNLLTEASNLHDVSARYQRIVGTLPPAQMDEPPALAEGIPSGADQALRLAYTQHPALAAAQENIVAAQSDAKTRNAAFLPRVDLRARQDFGNDLDGVDGSHKLTNIELLLNYNLYNGGADKAAERQFWEQVNVAKDMRDKACRDIRQTLYIAYNDVNRLRDQLTYLEQHQLSIEKARDAYRKQFDIGQRTLLDLLDTENELFEAKRAYQRAYYDHLYAMGRTQAGMGNLVGAMALQRPEASDLVKTEDKAAFDPDAVCPADVPNQLVIDKDKVFAEAMAAAGLTVAPNSAAGAVAPFPAAPAVQADADADGVPDARDRCPETPKGTRVDADGCPYKAVLELKGVTFALNSAQIAHEAYAVLDEAARILKANPKVTAEVSGHTDARNSDAFNQRLSERRAEAVMNYLVNQGVPAGQLTAKGYGESQPIADNASEAGMAKNRRVELRVIDRL
ncbi:MAG: TolC family outer membrane protein [Pseudomonadota bacterium]